MRARLVVVRRQLVVGLRIPPPAPRREPFRVHRVDQAAHALRRPGGVDVEASTVDRSGVQEHERWMDHGTRVRERHVEHVDARPECRIERAESLDDLGGSPRGKHADREIGGAHGHRHGGRRRLAGEIRQRPRLGERQRERPAGARDVARHRVRAERARREEHDVVAVEPLAERAADVVVRGRRHGDHDHLGAGERVVHVRRRRLEPACVLPDLGDQRDASALPDRGELGAGAAPQAHAVTVEREIRRRRERAVAAAEHRHDHRVS